MVLLVITSLSLIFNENVLLLRTEEKEYPVKVRISQILGEN